MTAADELDFSTSALIELMPYNSSNVVSHVYGGLYCVTATTVDREEMCSFHKVPNSLYQYLMKRRYKWVIPLTEKILSVTRMNQYQ